MHAQRVRMNVIANNLANIKTTRNDKGEFAPFLKKEVLFRTQPIDPNRPTEQGVAVHQIAHSNVPTRKIYDPGHPESDERGWREEPGVKIAQEMASMIEASRAYEANMKSMRTLRDAIFKSTKILRPLNEIG